MKFNYDGHSEGSGIYRILNTHNGRIYIGSAARFHTRWQYGHARSLTTNVHSNRFLRADFVKCRDELGHTDFLEFSVVELMESSTREERQVAEQRWIDCYYDNGKMCYNLQRKARLSKADLPDGNKGKKHSPERNAKIGAAHKGKKLSEEHKQKIGLASTGRGLGVKRAPEVGQRISASKLGKPHPFSDEGKVGLRTTYKVSLQSPDGTLYTEVVGLVKFATDHGLSPSGLRLLITGQCSKYKGWRNLLVQPTPRSPKASRSGSNNPFYGKTHTEESRQKISAKQTGLTHEQRCGVVAAQRTKQRCREGLMKYYDNNPDQKNRLGDMIKGKTLEEIYGADRAALIRKRRSVSRSRPLSGFTLQSPTGEVYTQIPNLTEFCNERGLVAYNMRRLLNGQIRKHKNWQLRENP